MKTRLNLCENVTGRWLVVAIMVSQVLSMTGCELMSYMASGISANKVPAKYELADRPTVILIDDPTNISGDPFLQRQIASEIAFQLKENEVTMQIIDQRKLDDLQNELGNDFRKTAIDEVGRQVDAEQVIYVEIKSVQYRAEPGMLRPMAVCEVKVIDAVDGKRLFPGVDDEEVEGSELPTVGYPVASTMFYRTQETAGEMQLVSKVLAERIGRDVSRLFHEYKPREPGEPFE